VDTPRNRDFVKRFHELHGIYPDMFDGETYEGLEGSSRSSRSAGTDRRQISILESGLVRGIDGAGLRSPTPMKPAARPGDQLAPKTALEPLVRGVLPGSITLLDVLPGLLMPDEHRAPRRITRRRNMFG